MFFKIIVLKKFVNFTGKHLYWSDFYKAAGPQNSNFIKKKLQHRFFPEKFSKFLRTLCFPAAASAGLRLPACNFVKKETPAKMISPWILQNFQEHLLTGHLWMIASCVYLRTLRNFSEHLFYRASFHSLFYVQVVEFQPPDTVKIFFTSAFQAFYTRTTSSHSKTLKS